jgi:hypothetical protein
MKTGFVFFIIIAFFSFASQGWGASLNISPAGNGAFVLQGVGLADVEGIDATITYDTSTLSSPQVLRGALISGAVMATNQNTPGVVRIAAVKPTPITGSGVIATINFNTVPGKSGKILSLNADVINSNGGKINVQTQVLNPAEDSASTDSATAGQTEKETVASMPSAGPGQISLGPTEAEQPLSTSDKAITRSSQGRSTESPSSGPDEQVAGETEDETSPGNQKTPASSPVSAVEDRSVKYKSVLDAFRDYTGNRTLEAFVGLFDKTRIPGVIQEPAIALSDGKTRVTVSIKFSSKAEKAPIFNFKNAKFISLESDGNSWILEMLPDKDCYESSITVLDNGSVTEIPLTIAPPVEKDLGELIATGAKEIVLARHSMESGNQPAKPDKAGTYLEDYIFTANYIVRRNSAIGNSEAGKKQEMPSGIVRGGKSGTNPPPAR